MNGLLEQCTLSTLVPKYRNNYFLGIRLVLVFVALILVCLSVPGAKFPWISWLMPIPLWFSLIGARPAQSILLLSIYGFFMWAISTWWLLPAIIGFVDLSPIIAFLLYVGVCVIGALPYTIFGFIYSNLRLYNKTVGVFYISIAFTVILSWFPSVIPSHPLYSQYKYPEVIQVLDIGGVPLLMFLMTFFQWSLVKSMLTWAESRKASFRWFFAALLTVVFVLSYGHWRLFQIEGQRQQADPSQWMTVGYVQPNFNRDDLTDDLFRLSDELLDQSKTIDLLVWPELPQYFSIVNNVDDRKKVLNYSKNKNTTMMVVSGYAYKEGSLEHGYYETSHLIDKGRIISSHNKTKLVPFFEYLPFEKQFPILRKWFPGVFNYIPGDQYKPMQLVKNIYLIPIICFEITSQNAMRRFINAGGNIMINPVNDYWFGISNGSAHHMALTLFKTVEYRVPWVRVANSGISGMVSASGEVVPETESGLFLQSSALTELYIPGKRSLYAHWGDMFLYVLTLVFLIMGVVPFILSRCKKNIP